VSKLLLRVERGPSTRVKEEGKVTHDDGDKGQETATGLGFSLSNQRGVDKGGNKGKGDGRLRDREGGGCRFRGKAAGRATRTKVPYGFCTVKSEKLDAKYIGGTSRTGTHR